MVMRFYPGRSPGHHYTHSSDTAAVGPDSVDSPEYSDEEEQDPFNITASQAYSHDGNDADADDYGELPEFSLENLEDNLVEEGSEEECDDAIEG